MGGADILSSLYFKQAWFRSKNMIKVLDPGLKSPALIRTQFEVKTQTRLSTMA